MSDRASSPSHSEPTAPANPAGAVAFGVDGLLAEARAGLRRVEVDQVEAERAGGAALIDIRAESQIAADGGIAGAWVVPRNVLEWRLDPLCEHRIRELAVAGRRVLLICDGGYQSSLAAAGVRRFGIDATDVIGGFQAWAAAGLPVDRGAQAIPV